MASLWKRPKVEQSAISDGSHETPVVYQNDKNPATVNSFGAREDDNVLGGMSLSGDVPDGIRKAQATTIAWTRKALIISYGLIFLIFFINSLQQQTTNNLSIYVTSDFMKAPLVSTTGIVSTLIAGIIKLPVAKLMDIWGRPQGFILMLSCAELGLVLMAVCRNVETYAAAQVFYWIGFNGIAYVLDVFIADTSSLVWRGLMFAFANSPYIATTFAGPAAAQSFLRTSGWRWAFGTYAIVTPFMCVPFLWVFVYNEKQAKRQGILVHRREASGRSWIQSLNHYVIEFDLVGVILLCAGWALILLPFSLVNYQAARWRSAPIVSMLVIGGCCLIGFIVYERFFAKKSFLPFYLLIDRTVLGSCLLAGTLFLSFYCWDLYLSQYLQVVFDLSIRDAGYIVNIYSIGSCFWGILVGLAIRYSGRFKWLAMSAVPLQILGTGLMIYFRQPHHNIGYVIMCQIFIAFSGGTLVVTEEIAIMAAVGPENVAVALALQALFTAIGGAIGTSISGAIWTNTVPNRLVEYLPESAKGNATEIYSSIYIALSYPVGSPERDAIIKAYAVAQRYMTITGTAVLVLALLWVAVWRDIKVKDFRKTANQTIL
ncbi:MFS general substrate transporter [Polychaeton citri CBS 116435]|uniref:MFS general substrate transporter n=1 Tax=Polychaeton citri CBS 116435 TaxID=1314669 RepID=A0A9P4UHR4_9PEZI|nr:MFS general substrate transporter [Polychaeton citri CBS 116435]